MTFPVSKDNILEYTATAGVGTLLLTGTTIGYQTFSSGVGYLGSTVSVYYNIRESVAGLWENGIGTYTVSSNTLSRDTVLSSSSGGAKVNFSGIANKTVTCCSPDSSEVTEDGGGAVTLPAGLNVTGTVAAGVVTASNSGSSFWAGADFSAGAALSSLTLNATNTAGGYGRVVFRGGATKTAWMVSAQNNVDNGLEITPSTAAGGTTFTTPLVTATTSGVTVAGTTRLIGGNANTLKIDNGGQQYTELDFANNGTVKASLYWDNTTPNFYIGSNGALTYASGNTSYHAWTSGSEKMRLDASGNLSVTGGATINGLTVGQGPTGGGSNVVLGASAFSSNSTGTANIAIGTSALSGSSSGSANVVVGDNAGASTTGSQNTFIGTRAGNANTSGKNQVFVGFYAGASATGSNNVFVGNYAGRNVTTGESNTFIGSGVLNVSDGAGVSVTTGSKNTILGNFTGNQNGLDIRTSSNNLVLADGDGTPLIFTKTGQSVALEGASTYSGTGVTFPSSPNLSANANTLDDYEEGSWTPTYGGQTTNPTVTYTIQEGQYVRVGKVVYFHAFIVVNTTSGGSGNLLISGLPYTSSKPGTSYVNFCYNWGANPPLVCNMPDSAGYLLGYTNQTSNSQAQVSALANGCYLHVGGFYFV